MASRRHLVSRSRANQDSSPASRPRHRDAPDREPVALPPYEPPSCPLNPEAQRALDGLQNHDYSKYKKHVETALNFLKGSAADINERLSERQDLVRRAEEKRREAGQSDEPKTEEDTEREAYARHMEKRVGDLTTRAEKALRDLIDYSDELAMHDSIMKDVSQNTARALEQSRQRSHQNRENDNEEENGSRNTFAENVEVPSAVELLKTAKHDYATNYSSKTMRERYDVNDYREFKRLVHDAQHPGDDAPPVPHVRTWFPEGNSNQEPGSNRRRNNNTTDNTSNADESDDDIIIERATTSFRCPLTLQKFREPYTSNICNHTFEKSAVLEYIAGGTVFNASSQPGRGRGATVGAKQIKCPSCDNMLEASQFFDDQAILRKMQRAKKQAEQEDEEDDDDDDDASPQRSQKTRPMVIDEGGDDVMDDD